MWSKYNSKMHERQEKHDSVSYNGATENLLQLFILYKIRDHAGSPDSEIYGHSWESFLDPCTTRKVYHIMNIQHGYHASPRFKRHFVNPVAAVAGLPPPPAASLLHPLAGCSLSGPICRIWNRCAIYIARLVLLLLLLYIPACKTQVVS